MNVLRFLHTDCVKLELETRPTEPTMPAEEESEGQRASRQRHDKERLLGEFSELLERSGAVVNRSKLLRDMINREKKATTAIVPGIAVPHVRTLQVRRFVMGLARADGDGFPFASLDGEPTKLFFLLASPPYDDRLYLQVYREFAQIVQREDIIDRILAAREVQDVYNALRDVFC